MPCTSRRSFWARFAALVFRVLDRPPAAPRPEREGFRFVVATVNLTLAGQAVTVREGDRPTPPKGGAQPSRAVCLDSGHCFSWILEKRLVDGGTDDRTNDRSDPEHPQLTDLIASGEDGHSG